MVFGLVKELVSEAQRERRAMRGMGKRELVLELASESLQYKEGRGEKDRRRQNSL